MKTSIRDIAKHAGTSIATVSYVLNNSEKHRISDATREKILRSVKELNYIPDVSAKNFKSGKRNLVGFVGPAVDNYFWSVLVESMEAELSVHGYNLMVVNARENPEKEISDIKLLSSGLTDGLIIESTLSDCTLIDKSIPTNTPVVFIDRALANCNHDAVYVSNYTCMYQGVTALVDSGHTTIGYIAGLEHLSTTKERLRAYRDAIQDRGVAFSESLVKYDDSSGDIASKLSQLIEQGCSALVVSTSTLTYITAIWLHNENLKDKIALLGYHDDAKDFCFIQSVGLISQPAAIMGKKAAELLVQRIKEPEAPLTVLTLQSELHLFQSPRSSV